MGSPVKLTCDYLLLPDDNIIHEIIDGEHYMAASPGTCRQTVSRRLQFLLYYERFSVPEFWLVNPERHTIKRFLLRDERYGESDLHADSIRYQAGVIDVTVDLGRVW